MPTADPTLSEDHVNDLVQAVADAPQEGSHLVDVEFFNPNDGTKGRPGGVYLDVQQRVDAEELRALSEGREPDYKNPPANAGTPLVTEAHRVDNTPSVPGNATIAAVNQVDPVSTLPVDVGVGGGDEENAPAETTEPTEETPTTTTPDTTTTTTPDSGSGTSSFSTTNL